MSIIHLEKEKEVKLCFTDLIATKIIYYYRYKKARSQQHAIYKKELIENVAPYGIPRHVAFNIWRGINTVGQSLVGKNRQLRSDPPIPRINIGPWIFSSLSPVTGFEICA